VHWDPFLHTWVATRYDDVATVLHRFSANRTPTPDQLVALGMESFRPVAEVMVRQMLYLDPPQHTRVRVLAANVFTPRRVDAFRDYVGAVVDRLLDAVH
jgi:cytochrome P450